MQTVKANDVIFEAGSICDTFYIIADGVVDAVANGHAFQLKKGDIVGIFDLTSETHICTYTAVADATLIPYPFKNAAGLLAMMDKQEDLRKLLMSSLNRNICNIIAAYAEEFGKCQELYHYILEIKAQYQSLCKSLGLNPKAMPWGDELQSFTLENELPFWMSDFYTNVRKIMTDANPSITSNFVYGYLDRSGQDIGHILAIDSKMIESCESFANYLMNEDYLDFYDLFCDLYLRAKANGDDTTEIAATIDAIVEKLWNIDSINSELIDSRAKAFWAKANATPKQAVESADESVINAELANSLGAILDYAETPATAASEFKKLLEQFKEIPDKSSTEKDVDYVRKSIAKQFYVIYSDVLNQAIRAEEVPTVIKMFLNFGYVDAELCGHANAVELYKLCETFHGNKEQGIYTAFEWFKAIFDGEKQPSRNEFDQDYAQYVRTIFKEGKINKETETAMNEDTAEKVMYELNNMFPSVNKITFGRIFTFCPILIEENLIRNLDDMLMTPARILETFTKLSSIDYSAFYHEMIFEDMDVNIKETVRVDIRPDVILMPNVGSKGVLWQEIEGMNRKTPGRMIISAFYLENVEKAFVRMYGEFRWEMCKRDQGARWNDVTSHSLTSDYCDYAQFFAKNRDLSYDTKEKIKETLKKCRNSFKEMFLSDYALYMMYEAAGSCRLNKTSRFIIFRYCPMGAEIREKLKTNTIFEDCLSKHRITTGQTMHRLEQVISRYTNSGKPVPDEIATQEEMLNR